MSDNMTINRLRFGFHRSDNRFQNSVPVLALLQTVSNIPLERSFKSRGVTSRRVLGYGYSLVKEPVPKSGTEYLLVSFN